MCCPCDPCTERLDEMLAPQEHLTLRSQPTEADYRAATVKQRPTGRRITSAEISVSSHRHTCAETHWCTLSLSLPRTHTHTHTHTYTHIHTHSHSGTETYKPQNNISMYSIYPPTYSYTIHTVLYIICVWNLFVSVCVSVCVFQSLFERQGMALHGGLHPGIERAHMQLPRGMSRTKSFGNTFHL